MGGVQGRQARMFFFEKKNQKTFDCRIVLVSTQVS
jgi:hypothetical protein